MCYAVIFHIVYSMEKQVETDKTFESLKSNKKIIFVAALGDEQFGVYGIHEAQVKGQEIALMWSEVQSF